MELLHSRPPYNFMGVFDQDYAKAKVVVLPVPYDSTASWKGGAREGPHAIISASRQVEFFDKELGCSPAEEIGIYTLNELEPSMASPDKTLERVEKAAAELLADGKFMVILGGAHNIPAGSVRPYAKKFKDLTVLQIDAHADLRDEFEDTRFNHACGMRRCREMAKKVVQCGIRSISQEEMDYVKAEGLEKDVFFMPDFDAKKIVSRCTDNVYLSFDLDGMDPASIPATGTPEPGGLNYFQILDLFRELAKKKNVVGADFVELAPIPGFHAPEFTVAKLIYKLIGYKFCGPQ